MNLNTCIVSLFLAVSLLTACTVLADTMQCGTKLISDGDSKAKVLSRCGEPFLKEIVGEKTVRSRLHGGFTITSETVLIERWTYNLGYRKFMRILTFEADKLVTIELGDKP